MKKNSVMSKIMTAVIAVLTVAICVLGIAFAKLNNQYAELQENYESLRAHDLKMQQKVNDYEVKAAWNQIRINELEQEAAEVVEDNTFITKLFNK